MQTDSSVYNHEELLLGDLFKPQYEKVQFLDETVNHYMEKIQQSDTQISNKHLRVLAVSLQKVSHNYEEILSILLHEEKRNKQEEKATTTPKSNTTQAYIGTQTDRGIHKKKRIKRVGKDKRGLRCTQCFTTDTPEWRSGPSGPRSLCNACGLQWSKKNKNKLLSSTIPPIFLLFLLYMIANYKTCITCINLLH